MYGMIHHVVKELVLEKFGEKTWEKILEASEMNEYDHFHLFEMYPDSLTFELVGGASTTLGLPVPTVLRVFGAYFLKYAIEHGYDKLMSVLGGDIVSFIQNLDSLHSLLSVSFKDIVAPSFRCFEEENGQLSLHYYSTRKGLYPIVEGLVEEVGKQFFSRLVKTEVVSETEEEIGEKNQVYHITMTITIKPLPGESKRVEWALGQNEFPKQREDHVISPRTLIQFSNAYCADSSESGSGYVSRGTETIVREEDFSLAFPYHMVMDGTLCLRQVGDHVQRFSLVPIQKGTPLREVAVIVSPPIQPSLENIMRFINSVFILAIHCTVGEKPLVIKGEMVWMPKSCHLLFMGSPRLLTFDDFKEKKMYLSDLPLYDATRDLVLLNHQRAAEIAYAQRLDVTRTQLKVLYETLAEEKQKCMDMLHEMLPPQIAQQLLAGNPVRAERFDTCTLLFSDVVMFTDIASKSKACDIINMLDEMYQRFDSHNEEHDVFKVETIGDAYMAVTGVPNVQADHAERMANFALDMMEEACHVMVPSAGEPIKIRVGIHTGPVVAGVVGRKKPRYDLYGVTVNIASLMESLGAPERIHVSKTTFKALYPFGYKFLCRGPMHIGETGLIDTYFLVGSTTHKLEQPTDRYSHLIHLVNPYPRPFRDAGARGKTAVSGDQPAPEMSSPFKIKVSGFSSKVKYGFNSLGERISSTGAFQISGSKRVSSVSSAVPTKSGAETVTTIESSISHNSNPYFGRHASEISLIQKRTGCRCGNCAVL